MCDRRLQTRSRFLAATLLCLLGSVITAPDTRAQTIVAGDVGPGVSESGSHVLAGALGGATVEPSSGVFRYSLPIIVPSARGGAQPGIGLGYSSAAGIREAGVGWGLNFPVIERRAPFGGPPAYAHTRAELFDLWNVDKTSGFTFNGEPLVPVCELRQWYIPNSTGVGPYCDAIPDVPLPDWVEIGSIYFRLENDRAGARFFWSQDRKTWRIQMRGGEILEFGSAVVLPLPGTEDEGIDFDERFDDSTDFYPPKQPPKLAILKDAYRWNLVRRFDPSSDGGAPRNMVVYRWRKLGQTGRGYLTDVYYTPPVSPDGDRPALESFAHHLRLVWQRPVQIRNAYPPIWRATPDHYLIRLDVASRAEASAPRELVRRHHLAYDHRGHRSFLTQFQIEGRCPAPVREVAEELPETTCPRLPATTMRYSEAGANRVPSTISAAPALRPGRNRLDLIPLDINGGSLPDLVETDPEHATRGAPGNPQRRLLLNNGTSFVADQISGPPDLLSRVGYSITGEFTFTGETGLWWWVPNQYEPFQTGDGPKTFVPRLGSNGWEWLPSPPWSSIPTRDPAYNFSLTAGSATWRMKLVGDINGDGLQDFINYPDEEGPGWARTFSGRWGEPPGGVYLGWKPTTPPSNWKNVAQIGAWMATRGGKGPLVWNTSNSCMGPSVSDMEGHWADRSRSLHLADMNGDSLADFVVVGPTRVIYWPSDGRGHFRACSGTQCRCTTSTTTSVSNSMLAHRLGSNPSSRNIVLADLNGDGYADLVSWDRDGLRVAYNNDGWFFREPIVINGMSLDLKWANNFDDAAVAVSIADMNGNGVSDLVITSGASMMSLDLHDVVSALSLFAPDAYAFRPNLLIEIDNGNGARTQVAYDSTTLMYRAALNTANAWPEPMPQTMHVVQRLTTATDVTGQKPASTYYSYGDPAWDGWERRFRGFRKVSIHGGDPQVTTELTYFIPSCPDRFCGSTDDTFGRQRAASGQVLISETRDYNKRYLSTVAYSYDVADVVKGLDGRWARASFVSQVDTRLYDTENWDPATTSSLQSITKGREPVWSGPVPTRARDSVLLRTTFETDSHGNLVKRTDHGRIRDNGDPIDDPLIANITMHPPRPDWRFLPERIRTEPFAARAGIPGDRPRTVIFGYDDSGRLATTSAILTGTLPLDRHHEDPTAAVAPPPPGASYDTLVLIAGYSYDEFDNIVRAEAPAGSCQTVAYDRTYADLPVRGSFYRDGCGTDAISKDFAWDRGLERVLVIRQPDGSSSTATYDAHGRLIQARSPNSATGAPAVEPSITIDYLGQAGSPVQRTRLETQLGSGRTHVSWTYSDGFGRTLLRLRQADPAAGDSGAWIVRGLPQLSTGGAVTGILTPWFYSGDPASHPLTAPATSFTKIVLDSFGRPVERWRPEGTLATRSRYRPLRTIHEDAAGRWSSIRINGLGRLEEQRSRTDQGEMIVTIDYLSGGEPARVIRERAGNVPAKSLTAPNAFVRWMQYDSLGRMVLNAEPNTSLGFNADPASASGLKAYRYAYNWSGQLVGTSDARGCGWNIHYDRLGREIAQDLSPCLRSQAVYSTPDLTNGNGTEVFNHYDTPEPGQVTDFGTSPQLLLGRLVSTRDLAAHSRFAYDARGRLTGLARRLAKPADATTAVWPGHQDIASRYAADWFRSAVEYDTANRMIRATTGASAPELLDAEGNSELLVEYSLRSLVSTVRGSYGTLLSGLTYDQLDRRLTAVLGDAASTLVSTSYKPGGGLDTFKAARMPPSLWSLGAAGYTPPGPSEPPTTQTILEDLEYHYDSSDLLAGIDDRRPPTAWPVGAKPVSRLFTHDLLGRLARTDYKYAAGSDPFDPAAAPASAIPRTAVSQRPGFQTFSFDEVGNLRDTADDAPALFDRSVGTITRGSYDAGPNQFVSAANGDIQARHDPTGNLVSLSVRRSSCADPAGLCTHYFVYDWDEVGQLARARRWDYSAASSGPPAYPALPSHAAATDIRYRYDASGQRVLRSTVAPGNPVKHSAWPLPMLRLDGADFNGAASAYTRSAVTEQVVLPGIGRVVHRQGLPGPSPRHVLLRIGDHLGSTSIVIDKATGELVERLTYLAYGSLESAYRPQRWGGLETHEQFSGKESDSGIGLVYFGARYYFPILGQWISPDPLTIHSLSLPDLNPYSYVSGRVMQLVDPLGLQPCFGFECRDSLAGFTFGGFQIGFGGAATASPPGEGYGPAPAPPGSIAARGNPGPPPPSPAPGPKNSSWFTSLGNAVHSTLLMSSPAYALERVIVDPAKTLEEMVLQRAELVASVLGGNYSSVFGPIKHRDPIDAEAAVTVASFVPGPGGPARLFVMEARMARWSAGPGTYAVVPAVQPQMGGINLTAAGDEFGVNASLARPVPGFTDVIMHGNLHNVGPSPTSGPYSFTKAANAILNDPAYPGGPVRLISCQTGACGSTAAQNLANMLGEPVLAPTDTVWAVHNGSLIVGPNPVTTRPGEWILFNPMKTP